MDDRLKRLLEQAAQDPTPSDLDLASVHSRAKRQKATKRVGATLGVGVAAVLLVAMNLVGGSVPASDPTFSVLDRPPNEADDSLTRIVRLLGLDPERQLDPESVRSQVSVGDWHYGLATKGEGQFLCVVRGDVVVRVGSTSCVRIATLVTGFIAWVSGDAPGPHVVLAVADDITTVVVGDDRLGVEENMIALHGPDLPSFVTLVGTGGEVRISLPSPPPAGLAPAVTYG